VILQVCDGTAYSNHVRVYNCYSGREAKVRRL
jgi:hypothetical protein